MTIEELHDKLFDALCTVDDICNKEKVRYFLNSGSAIGAVREHGFIKWDDDVDLMVLAEDYPKFKAAMEKNLPPYMHIIEPEIFAPHFYDFIVRIYDERYLIRERNDEDDFYNNYQNYVGCDVFIHTKTPDSESVKKKLLLSTKILYGLGMAHRYKLDFSKYSSAQKAEVKVLSLAGKLFKPETIIRWQKELTMKYADQPSAYRFTGTFSLKSLTFIPERCYKETAYMPIRDRMFPVAGGYDEELTIQYGDYMNPPKDTTKFVKHLR